MNPPGAGRGSSYNGPHAPESRPAGRKSAPPRYFGSRGRPLRYWLKWGALVLAMFGMAAIIGDLIVPLFLPDR